MRSFPGIPLPNSQDNNHFIMDKKMKKFHFPVTVGITLEVEDCSMEKAVEKVLKMSADELEDYVVMNWGLCSEYCDRDTLMNEAYECKE